MNTPVQVPVRLQVGDGELVEIGTVDATVTVDATGALNVTMGSIPDVLREAADDIETAQREARAEDTHAAT